MSCQTGLVSGGGRDGGWFRDGGGASKRKSRARGPRPPKWLTEKGMRAILLSNTACVVSAADAEEEARPMSLERMLAR
jgi:hypothetical protein